MKTNILTHTSGKGLWSSKAQEVHITDVSLNYVDEDGDFGELLASFARSEWEPNEVGLIYTDPLWLEEFRKGLIELGISEKAAAAVDYSEQGMQGDDYVSLDVGPDFFQAGLASKLFG